MNRVDQQETVVPQASIPARPTESVGVLYWRQQLRIMQAAQRTYVLASDRERMVHVAAHTEHRRRRDERRDRGSGRQARARAESRRLQIQRRAFTVLPNSTTLLRPCA